ncbi:antitoxin [Candidatus Peregrinibacteria bacterium CG11_big_fil_rev_8_21_14_0_20_41_10]|nr:MAG: antitoxin [Candidatus Peregrinibacteria bacterium CG11_big_fil_rev_8_21_14_0_20_41_10]PIZ75127.1 MAG: antitoxin [Candidatus Peregrinibacteria bacterium CG_4_10_14_0_2_um_filter_41_8]
MTNKKISVSSNVLFGKPRIKGTRISVEQVLAALAEGISQKDLIKEFGITAEDVQGC